MFQRRNKIYLYLIIACMAGYGWLYFNISFHPKEISDKVTFCIVKHTTNIPCPSCGSTRAVVSLLSGNFIESLYWNPIGLILIILLMFTPLWIIYDLINKKETLHKIYIKTEEILRKRVIAVPAVLIILINWIWNISKGL